MIQLTNDVIYNNENIDKLDDVFKNLSYKTGKACDDDRELKYFEY